MLFFLRKIAFYQRETSGGTARGNKPHVPKRTTSRALEISIEAANIGSTGRMNICMSRGNSYRRCYTWCFANVEISFVVNGCGTRVDHTENFIEIVYAIPSTRLARATSFYNTEVWPGGVENARCAFGVASSTITKD